VLATGAGHHAALQQRAILREEAHHRTAWTQPESQRTVSRVVEERKARVIAVDRVELAAAGAVDQLRDPVDRMEWLHVVVMAREHDRGMGSELREDLLQGWRVAVEARAEEGVVIESDPAGAEARRRPDRLREPPQLVCRGGGRVV